MNRYEVLIEDTGERYLCREDRNLLEGMETLGRKGVPVGCRNGGCGVCKVRVTDGEFRTRVMSRAHVSADQQDEGVVLACRAYPLGPLSLSVLGAMRKNVCRPMGVAPVGPPAPTLSPLPLPAPVPGPMPSTAPTRPALWVSTEPNDAPRPDDPWAEGQAADT